jgi:putative nucleotidyltransferase with HDIG domain
MSRDAVLRNLTSIRLFAGGLALLAGIALAASLATVGVKQWSVIVALAAVAAIAERQSLEISPGLFVSVSFLPMALAAVTQGPAAAALVGGIAMLGDRTPPVERFVIYTAGRTLSGAASGGAAMLALHAVSSTSLAGLVVASAAAALAGMSVDFTVAGAITILRGRLGAAEMWRKLRASLALSTALYAPITALFAYAYTGAGEWVLLFFLIPVLAAHLSLRMHARQAQLIGELEETNDQLAGANVHLRKVNLSFATAMVHALDSRDNYTAGHSAAVAVYSRDIAKELGMPQSEVERVHLCALLHDIGKIGLRAEILQKTSALTDDEWEEMRDHSRIGAEILGRVEDYADVSAIVRSHHERWDGAGYPDGLSADQIPKLARIIAVADSYNAMTSDRPYRRAMTTERAIQQLALGKESQFESALVEAFLAVLERESEPYRRGIQADFKLEAIQHSEMSQTRPGQFTLRSAVA